MTLLPRIKDAILNGKQAKDLRVIETGVKIAGFEYKLPKAISDSDVIVIVKTGISHGMSELIVSEAKNEGFLSHTQTNQVHCAWKWLCIERSTI